MPIMLQAESGQLNEKWYPEEDWVQKKSDQLIKQSSLFI